MSAEKNIKQPLICGRVQAPPSLLQAMFYGAKKSAASVAAATADALRVALKSTPEGYLILQINQILEARSWIGSGTPE